MLEHQVQRGSATIREIPDYRLCNGGSMHIKRDALCLIAFFISSNWAFADNNDLLKSLQPLNGKNCAIAFYTLTEKNIWGGQLFLDGITDMSGEISVDIGNNKPIRLDGYSIVDFITTMESAGWKLIQSNALSLPVWKAPLVYLQFSPK
jgi:hypothetical protein